MNNKVYALIVFVLFILSSQPVEADVKVKYRLKILDVPTKAELSIDTSKFGQFQLTSARRTKDAISETADIQCVKGKKKFTALLEKNLECDKVIWAVNFITSDGKDHDMSLQNNLYSEQGWWLMTEWNVLLQVKGIRIDEICLENSEIKSECMRIPGVDEPPLFYLFGHWAQEMKIVEQSFYIFSNKDLSNVLSENSSQILKKQYQYLINLTGATTDHSIRLLWYGVSRQQKKLGGAAGFQSYLANFYYDSSKVDIKSLQRLFWISGHELFHMLNPQSYPLWISESLAHYYGYKSLRNAGFTIEKNSLYEYLKKNTTSLNSVGLYEAHQKVVVDNDYQYYGNFYDKGALFWLELDDLLQKNGADLDDYLTYLDSDGSESYRLPVKFVEMLSVKVGRDNFVTLQKRYLTD